MRDLPMNWLSKKVRDVEENEGPLNPKVPLSQHVDVSDPIIDRSMLGLLAPNAMPPTILNFDGIPFPGVTCNCRPPDTDGAVGQTQYVQMVNRGFQVFDKTTGASVLGPLNIASIWSGFGGVCETRGIGDPVVLYDHIANRWLDQPVRGSRGSD